MMAVVWRAEAREAAAVMALATWRVAVAWVAVASAVANWETVASTVVMRAEAERVQPATVVVWRGMAVV